MNEEEQVPQDMKQYYVLGIVVLIAVVVAGYLLRPKSGSPLTTPADQNAAVVATPTPGPITKLGCDLQYYNPRIGFPEYYLSVEGGDLSSATNVDCVFTASQSGKIVATEKATSPLTDKPQRGGSTFRCTTNAVKLTPRVVSVVNVELKDDKGATASCSAPFVFVAP